MQKNNLAKWIIALCFFVVTSLVLNIFHPIKPIFIFFHIVITFSSIISIVVIIKKITNIIRELSHSNMKLQSIFETTDIAIWYLDLKANKLLVTAGIEKIYGRSLDEFQQNINLWREVIHPDDLYLLKQREEKLKNKQNEVLSKYRILQPDGNIRWIKDRGSALYDESGNLSEFTSVLMDITNSQENEDKFSSLVEMSPDIIAVTHQYKLHYINEAGKKILGAKSVNEIIGKPINYFLSIKDYDRVLKEYNRIKDKDMKHTRLELEFITVNRDTKILDISFMPILFDGKKSVLLVGRDITARKKADSMIKSLAYKDSLTELPNRNRCMSYLHSKLSKTYVEAMSILFFDLDQFKRINDTKGHSTGDIILKSVASRIKSVLEKHDFVARLGGDEFLILLENKTREETATIAKAIIEEFSSPIIINNDEFFVTPSIGISMYPIDGLDQETLIKNADAAMYLAKDEGKNNYQFYSCSLAVKSSRKMELEMALRKAILNKELQLHYQPQIDVKSGKVTGVEALLRWNHSKYGSISPAEFIPIAEETNLMLSIGEWVITEAFTQKKKWDLCGATPIKMAVNISARQFQHSEFINFLKGEINRLNLNTANIELEITETIMQNIESAKLVLSKVKELGFLISIDDFGMGYSSLSYLKSLPIDIIKIDKSFIDDIN
ncbi:MAG TPA: EAL domain-containing protein, partial [Niallia sp.]|nr:EAL domain-containing protein [Niallia sp.]